MKADLQTDIDLLVAHVEYFCDHDARGRLVDGRRRAPRFWLGRSRLGNIWRLGAGLDEGRVRDLSRVIAREPGLAVRPGWKAPPPPERAARIRTLLEEDAPIEEEWCGPTFLVPQALDVSVGEDDPIRILEAGDVDLLVPHFPDRAASLADPAEGRDPWLAWVEEDVALGWCRTASRDPSRFAEASVATAAGHRGRGIAPKVVAAWAAAIRTRGGVPLYSTEWTNTASLAVARKLGLAAHGESWHVR